MSSFYEIVNNIVNNKYTIDIPYPRRNPNTHTDYITDETKSVLWNIEQVNINKDKYCKELEAYRKKECDMENKFMADMVEAIKNELGNCTEEAAKFIYREAYEEGHPDGYCEITTQAEKIVSLINMFNDLNKEEIL